MEVISAAEEPIPVFWTSDSGTFSGQNGGSWDSEAMVGLGLPGSR